MLDHALLDIITALRDSLADALLERQRVEERLQVDILLGDVTWESSYSLPGEGDPPRVRADLSLDWPTWSQTAYRAWGLGEPADEPPEVGLEVALRVQDLAAEPDIAAIAAVLPHQSPALGPEPLALAAPSVERVYDRDLADAGWAVEFVYEGTYELSTDVLEDRQALRAQLAPLGRWLASTLVQLGDLQLAFRPDPGPSGDG